MNNEYFMGDIELSRIHVISIILFVLCHFFLSDFTKKISNIVFRKTERSKPRSLEMWVWQFQWGLSLFIFFFFKNVILFYSMEGGNSI